MKKQNDRYQIIKTVRGKTSKGANYFNIEAKDTETGEIVNCLYFGNTTPKRLISIQKRETENTVYMLAEIQPHTSRDRKTGRFISYKRVGAHI